MEYIQIPNLTQKTSRIGLGTWAIGGWMWGGTDKKRSIETIHHALDLGINLVDTAPVYGFGVSEQIVGEALKSYGGRDKVILSTKTGLCWENGKIFRDARKEVIFKQLEESLERLQTDWIDIYHIHWPDLNLSFDETAEAMHTLLKEGKIRAIAVSNFSVEMVKTFRSLAPLHVLQPPFNLYERGIEEKELAYSLKEGIATLGYGVLCRGLLSGKMHQKREFVGDDLRKVDPKFSPPLFEQYLKCNELLTEWAQSRYGRSLSALAARWVLDKKISVALWGARESSQLDVTKELENWKLNANDLSEIDQILQTVKEPVGPEFMSPPTQVPSL